MKDIKKVLSVAVFSLFAFQAFAEVALIQYEDYSEVEPDAAQEVVEIVDETQPVVQPVAPAATSQRALANVQRTTRQTNNSAPSRAVASRSATVRSNSVNQTQGRPVSSRTASYQGDIATDSRATTRSRVIANAITTGRADSLQNEKSIQARAGSLYVPARVGVTTSNVVSNGSRAVSARASSSTTLPTLFDSTSSTTKKDATTSSASASEELAAQTDFCKARYASCMDNFCNILDDNQGRCTCSGSITKYEKTEDALKAATIELQDIATKIRYLGLTKEEVSSIFSQTAAEEAMGRTVDNSVLKSSLESIQKLLIDPQSATVSSGSVLSVDMSNLDFGNGFDINSLMNSDESVQNQRGDALFDTARARCANVITDCRKQGVETTLVTASYDMEIDKQCVAYERTLIDSNDQMKATIRNATTVLQQARLVVAQNKNKYDLKGCVSALDSCMTDDFVCGSDYENCLDVFGQYIVAGDIVIGSSPNKTTSPGFVDNWKYGTKNAFYTVSGQTLGSLTEMITATSTSDNNLVKFLKAKIGTIDASGRAIGMCSNVLNQCQAYTFVNNTYQESNTVITEYMARTLVKIKTEQDEVMSAYGEGCRQDIISCFVKNGATSTRPTTYQETIVKSCWPYVKTCGNVNGMSAFDGDVAAYVCPTGQRLPFTLNGASVPTACST